MFGLSLNGFGHLCERGTHQNGDSYITLHLINKSNDAFFDDIWLECQVNKKEFPIIAELDQYLAVGKSVIVNFDAQYLAFKQHYSGMTEHDPRSIIHLQGKLTNIHQYYVRNSVVTLQLKRA
jgi:hypothetical protein